MFKKLISLLRSSNQAGEPLSLRGVDMHAHWLPGIDDGAKDMAMSLEMIRSLADMGCPRLIATPHVMVDLYPNSSTTIRQTLARTRTAAQQAGLEIQLDAAAEYLIDEGFPQLLQDNDLLTFSGNKLLVELSFVAPPPDLDAIFFTLLTKGYQPVLAHPERYRYYHHQFDQYRGFVDKGIALQVNLLSLAGHYGTQVKETAEKLISRGLVSYWGSDAHHPEHLDKLQSLLQSRSFAKVYSSSSWHNDKV